MKMIKPLNILRTIPNIFFLLLFLLILISPEIFAVGISARPLSPTVFYEPGKEYVFDYEVIINSPQTMDYLMITKDFPGRKSDLTPYIIFDPAKLEKIAPGAKQPFKVKLSLPTTPLVPGKHRVEIGVEDSLSTGGEVGAKTRASDVITVVSLFSGKYLITQIIAKDISEGQTEEFSVAISNYGTEDITSAGGIIDIYDQSGVKIGTVQTDSKSLKSKESDQLTATFDTTGFKAGNYKAAAKINYDGKEAEQSNATFKIGTLNVDILSFTQSVKPGTINKFDVKIKSGWSEKIGNVYAKVKIGKNEFNTLPITLPPFAEATLSGFFDTTSVSAGEYDATVTLFYGDKTAVKTGKVSVAEKTTAVLQTEIPKAEIKAGEKKTNWTLIIILILAVAVGGYLGYGYWQKKHEEEQPAVQVPVQPAQPQSVQPAQPQAPQQIVQPAQAMQPQAQVAQPTAKPKRKAAKKRNK